MIGLLQRVSGAAVRIDGEVKAEISRGLLVFVGVRKDDDQARADRLLSRVLTYRVFPDEHGKMNESVQAIKGGILLVPQFTLAADTRKGTRASFSTGADPDTAKRLFEYLCQKASATYRPVAFGSFAANMQVRLVNDGPVTFWLET